MSRTRSASFESRNSRKEKAGFSLPIASSLILTSSSLPLTPKPLHTTADSKKMGYDDRSGPSRGGRGGGGGRSSHPYSRGGGGDDRGGRRDDNQEEVIEISSNRLYVHNLSWRVSWQDLKDHFRQAGEVIHTKILTEGPGGRSKGCGIVEMDTVDAAANAVEMLNDTDLQGRNILIREDREDNGGRGDRGDRPDRGDRGDDRPGTFRSDDRRGPPVRNPAPGGGGRDTCNKCGGVGHWARDCPSVIDIGRGGGGGRYDDRRGGRDDHDRRAPPARAPPRREPREGRSREPRERKAPGPDDKCNRCGGGGHWARDCTQTDTRERRAPGTEDKCNKCGQTGHWARECPSGGGGGKAAGDAPMDGAKLDNDLDTYFDGAKDAAPAAGDEVMA